MKQSAFQVQWTPVNLDEDILKQLVRIQIKMKDDSVHSECPPPTHK